jgi:hypothetical protein
MVGVPSAPINIPPVNIANSSTSPALTKGGGCGAAAFAEDAGKAFLRPGFAGQRSGRGGRGSGVSIRVAPVACHALRAAAGAEGPWSSQTG